MLSVLAVGALLLLGGIAGTYQNRSAVPKVAAAPSAAVMEGGATRVAATSAAKGDAPAVAVKSEPPVAAPTAVAPFEPVVERAGAVAPDAPSEAEVVAMPLAAGAPARLTSGIAYKMVTASVGGTHIQFGRDLAKFVAPEAGIDLEVLPSSGSTENIQRLRSDTGVKFALVQSDVMQAFTDQGAAGNKEAANAVRNLRAIMPLHSEEIHVIARADSPFNFVHDIKGARMNVGPLRSGSAMTATTLYRVMFGESVAEERTEFLSHEEALRKLTRDKTLDVMVVVAGQPSALLADMKPEARAMVKLLKFDRTHPAGQLALKTYFASTLKGASYPTWVVQDVPSLAVKAFLVTYDFDREFTQGTLAKFARSLCKNFGVLQTQGHPKWKEVALALPDLGRGWRYYPPTATVLSRCLAPMTKWPPSLAAGAAAVPAAVIAPAGALRSGATVPKASSPSATVPAVACPVDQRALGLCR